MCPSAPRVCSEPGGQKPVLSMSLDRIVDVISIYAIMDIYTFRELRIDVLKWTTDIHNWMTDIHIWFEVQISIIGFNMDMHIGLWIFPCLKRYNHFFIFIITHVQLGISVLQIRYIHNSIMDIHNYSACSLCLYCTNKLLAYRYAY